MLFLSVVFVEWDDACSVGIWARLYVNEHQRYHFLCICDLQLMCGIPSLCSICFCRLSYFFAKFNTKLSFFWPHFGSYEVVLTLDKEKHKFEGPIYYYVFNSLLFSLLVLHIYWWVLIYRMLARQIQSRGHIGDDVRSGMFLLIIFCTMHLGWKYNLMQMHTVMNK